MLSRRLLGITAGVTILAFLLAACAPAAAPVPAKAGTPAVAQAPQTKAAAPSPTAKPSASAPTYGGTLTMALKTATAHFDMLQETGGMVQLPLAPTYNLLIQHNPMENFKITGDLARSWEISPDGLSYIFLLNEGVRFHNGRPLSAEDVRFNFERVMSPPRGILSPRKELFRNVQKMEVIDAKTLKIALKQPQASFLTIVALPANFIFDPEVIKQKGDMKRDVMGTGPFKMKDYVYSISFTAEKNPDYFVKGRPYLDRVIVYTITDEMTRSAAMRTRQVLVLPLYGAVSTSLSLQMQKTEPSIVLQKRGTPGPNVIIPNSKVAPWNDVRVRQAVNLAIEREAASKAIREFGPGYGFMLPGSPWELPKEELMAMPGNRQPKDPDIAEAKRLLAEAGFPEGFETPFLSSTTVYSRELAQVAQAQLARIGINLKIQSLEISAWKDLVFKGSFRLATQPDASAIDDPDVLLGEYFLTGSPKNYHGWSNQKFDELYALQSRIMDAAKRKEIVWEMQRILHRELPRIPVVWSTFYAASWPEVKNWTQGNSLFLGNSLQDVWLVK
ncbi:MAG: ABC transporter substrate-binding protein [Chloroflexi bacterium]|nr:ABC transporter substrate-binding protein [Chloroflexota bacterium]